MAKALEEPERVFAATAESREIRSNFFPQPFLAYQKVHMVGPLISSVCCNFWRQASTADAPLEGAMNV